MPTRLLGPKSGHDVVERKQSAAQTINLPLEISSLAARELMFGIQLSELSLFFSQSFINSRELS